MFENHLDKYTSNDFFVFRQTDDFASVCNAPTTASGIYLISELKDDIETILYIGSSGRKKNGVFSHRKGGIWYRLVNGYHPNKFGLEKRLPRHKAFPVKMKTDNIEAIIVRWWVTYDTVFSDFPTQVERILTKEYRDNNNQRMPPWHT